MVKYVMDFVKNLFLPLQIKGIYEMTANLAK